MVTATAIKKGYKQTELGIIPEDWAIKKLGALGPFSKGQGIRKDQSQSGELPCVRYGELYTRHNDYVKQYYSFISKEVAATSKRLAYGDILFAGSGETKEEIGKCAAFIDNIDAYAGGDIVIFSPRDTDSLFLGYLLNSPLVVKQKANKGQGDAVVHISASSLKEVNVPIPQQKEEQTSIAVVLSDTDALIERLGKLIAKKKAIKQGTMQQLMTGKVRLPGYSSKWLSKKIGDVVKCMPSGIYGKDRPGDGLVAFPVATTAHISEEDLWNNKAMAERYFSRKQIGEYSPKTGDIVVVKSSGSAEKIKSGKLGRITDELSGKFVFSNFLLLIRPTAVCSQFLYYYLTSFAVKSILPNLCEASTYPNLRINEYLNIEMPYPEYEEQCSISSVLVDMDLEISCLTQQRDKYVLLKQGMMQQLLTGKIRIYANK